MKKILVLMLVLCMVFAFASCADNDIKDGTQSTDGSQDTTTPEKSDVMTHEQFVAAELEAEVVVETYVQATQSWWEDKITVYCQSPDGAYFLYELKCSEADAAKLTPGTKIKVKGFKAEWSGEVEIVDATFEFVEGGDAYIAEAFDATALLGKDELIDHQNEFVSFNGLTIEKIEYQNGEPGKDIYVTFKKDDASYSFCVESYLTSPETELYKAFAELEPGDVVDVEGFLYWYEGVNTHITAVSKSVMTHEQFVALPLESEVVIETYVQAHQSWWDNKITVYCQSKDGAYFLYELACTKEDAAKLVPGTKIKVNGFKAEWAGEVEIVDATFEFVEGDEKYVAEAFDATALLGKDELIDHQNEFVVFKNLTVEKIEYQNGEPGKDIYVTFKKDDASYSFCVESYLTAPDSDLYKAVGELEVGDSVDVEGFLYWYEGVNTHITAVKTAE